MASKDTKLPLFHSNGTNNPKQYWFLYEVVWTVRQATDDDVKKVQLVTTLRVRALDWHMNFIQVPTRTLAKTLDEVRKGLIEEFWKPKSEAQYITELKEIKQFPNETIWDFDQRFKTLMARVSFDMSDTLEEALESHQEKHP